MFGSRTRPGMRGALGKSGGLFGSHTNPGMSGSLGSLGGCTLARNTLACDSLRGDSLGALPRNLPESPRVYSTERLWSLEGDDSGGGSPIFTSYGRQAARVLMAGAMAQPEDKRKAFLKTALDKIDPTIWARAQAYANARRGVPASAAVESGIARAMSEGIVKELVNTGKQGTIKRRSQLGLGCLGSSALGQLLATSVTSGTKPAPTTTAPMIMATSVAGCVNPPAGYTWINGAWARVRAGAVEAPTPAPGGGCYVIDQVTHLPGVRPSGTDAPAVEMMQVGPWQVPVDATTAFFGITVRDHRTGAQTPAYGVNAAWQKRIGDEIVRQWQFQVHQGVFPLPGSCVNDPMLVPASDLGITVPPLLKTLLAAGAQPDSALTAARDSMSQAEIDNDPKLRLFASLPICKGTFDTPGNRSRWPSSLTTGGWVPARFFGYRMNEAYPLFRSKHPKTGEDYGMFLQASPIEGGNAALAPSQGSPGVMRLDHNADGDFLRIGGPLNFVWRKITPFEKSRWARFWDFIVSIPARIIETVAEIIDKIGDIACAVLNHPAAATAATVGAGIYGAPPEAGAAGVLIAQGICAGTQPPPPVAPGSSMLVPLMIAGGAGLLILAVARKRK